MIEHIDHLVITTRDIHACTDFYTRILGMDLHQFGDNRMALTFGQQKINIHEYGKEIEPKAHLPVPGSLDICFITRQPIADVLNDLRARGANIVDGPVSRTGALGPITSVYLRDPDLNLIEVSNYDS